jgi:phosphonate transport system substrate-binding protein
MVLPLATLEATGGCDQLLPEVDLAETAATAASPSAGEAPAERLRIAVGPMLLPETTRLVYADLLRFVTAEMGAGALLLQRRTGAELNALIEQGAVDAAFVDPAAYVVGHDAFGLELCAVPVARGQKPARSFLVVPAWSSADGLGGLRGKRFALTDPLSYAGYGMPLYILLQRQESFESYFLETFYTRSDEASLGAVASGQADGAALLSTVYFIVAQREPELTARLRVVGESPPFAMPPVVVHPALADDTKEALRAVLLTAHEQPTARPLLDQLMIDRFVLGDDADFDPVRAACRSARCGTEE